MNYRQTSRPRAAAARPANRPRLDRPERRPARRAGAGRAIGTVSLAALVCLATATPVEAYIGPGAGFAALGSVMVLLLRLRMMLLFTYPRNCPVSASYC